MKQVNGRTRNKTGACKGAAWYPGCGTVLTLERRDGSGLEDQPSLFLLLSISVPYYSQVLIPQNNYAIAD